MFLRTSGLRRFNNIAAGPSKKGKHRGRRDFGVRKVTKPRRGEATAPNPREGK